VARNTSLAKGHIREQINLGPAERQEISEKWMEFSPKAANEMYRTKELVAHKHALVMDSRFTLGRLRGATTATAMPMTLCWSFHEWALSQADTLWRSARYSK
jgi:hypothetical protein